MQMEKKITLEHALYFCIAALFCVTPISSSLKSIFLSASIILVLIIPKYRQELAALIYQRFFLSGLLLVLIAALGCLWSPASTAEKALILEKWSKLLYLPCLVVALKNYKMRQMAINAFLFAMVFTCICSFYLKFFNVPLTGKMQVDGIFRNHIMTSIMVSFAAYLGGMLFIKTKNIPRILYLGTVLITSSQILLINKSRTGYVIYLILMLLLVLQNTNKRKALLSIIAVCSLFAASYYVIPNFWNTIQLTKKEWSSYQTDKNTSIGYRLQFHAFAEKLFKSHPIIGNGTGSFTYKFRTENPVPAWTSAKIHSGRLLEPHGQYWLIAAEFGGIGLLVFLFFYAELAYRTYKLENMRPIALALFVILVTGNLTDSLLFYSGSGYFFILFFALAFSEKANSNVIIKSLHKSINKKYSESSGTIRANNL